jgi:hypothetical protein
VLKQRPCLIIGFQVKTAPGNQCDHQTLVKNAEAAKHSLRFAIAEVGQQVDNMGREFLLFRHFRGRLVFDDASVRNRKLASSFVYYFPFLVSLVPVNLLGAVDIEVVAAITLLELHQNQIIFSGIIKYIQILIVDGHPCFISINPAFVAAAP